MKELIYYPGFEVRDINWLKFALLYIGKLNPIVPKSADPFLNDLFYKIENETDLISPHRPEKREVTLAMLDAIDSFDRILDNPKMYCSTLGYMNFLDMWKNTNFQNYTLYREKYPEEFEKFLLKNELGKEDEWGINVHREVGLVYMTLLANAIADGRGVSPITDYETLDWISILIRRQLSRELSKEISLAKYTIALQIPYNLENIDLDTIIDFRKQRGFRNRLRAFHNGLENFLKEYEHGLDDQNATQELVSSFNDSWKEFFADIAGLGMHAASIGLGIWLIIKSSDVKEIEIIEQGLGIGGLSITGLVTIRKTWNNTKTKRLARRYLADLSKLK